MAEYKSFVDDCAIEVSILAQYMRSGPGFMDCLEDAVLAHQRTHIVGTGKSYHVARLAVRIAQSYSLPFNFIDATHLLHGDAGLIRTKDLMIYISKSGESKEVIDAAKYLSEIDSIAITCAHDCNLARMCDRTFVLPLNKEHSLYGRAPMASSILFLCFLFDLINRIALVKCTEEQYLSAHPGGTIGLS